MSERKEKLKYQLQKLHRDKLEQELEAINEELSEYYQSQQKESIKRRRENIYVLFALAIIGGFFSLIPRTSYTINTSFIIGFGVFASASLLFLIIKINTIALTKYTTKRSKLDNYSEYLFAFSINGILLLGGAVTLVNVFNIQTDEIYSTFVLVLLPGLTSFMITLYKYVTDERKRKQRRIERMERSESIREEMLDELSSKIEDIQEVDDQKRELELFHELTEGIEHAKDEFVKRERLEPIAKEMEDIEGVSDHITEVLREKLQETQKSLRSQDVDEESIEEKKDRLREEYEEMVSEKDS